MTKKIFKPDWIIESHEYEYECYVPAILFKYLKLKYFLKFKKIVKRHKIYNYECVVSSDVLFGKNFTFFSLYFI